MLRKILILGSEGMFGSYLLKELYKNNDFQTFASSRKSLTHYCDFEDKNSVISLLEKINPDIVINCVAISSIDYCENFIKICSLVNAETPRIIAEWCNKSDSYFVHISTDHFFSNDGKKAHSENSKVKIVNNYADSKYKAEKYIREIQNTLILRTSIIGLTNDKRNFLDWSLHNLYENNKVGLYFNSYTSFVHCIQLSKILIKLLDKHLTGTYNLASGEVFSKAEFYLELAKALKIKPNYFISDINELPIKRADSCGLSIKRIQNDSNFIMPSLKEVIKTCVEEQGIKEI